MADNGADSSPLASVSLSKEAMESLSCSICMDFLYKPIVTACGHIFCFWCGHNGMNNFAASSCPLCRRPFMYFPRVCKLLHLILMKAAPAEYARRDSETRLDEEKRKSFSPELAPEDHVVPPDSQHGKMSSVPDVDTLVDSDNDHNVVHTSESNRDSQCGQEGDANTRQGCLTKDDLCCALCHGLLYRPVVLNCGDVFCEPCLTMLNFDVHCPACKAPHPPRCALVCLELDQILQSEFPAEYAERRLQQQAKSTSCFDYDKVDRQPDALPHIGVGCDGCGMFPIIGDRYKCEDCKDKMGYDLCGSCYNNSASVMGRFNQKHQATHGMTKIELDRHMEEVLRTMRFVYSSAYQA